MTDQTKASGASFEQLISGLHHLSHSLSCESDQLLLHKFGLGISQFKIVWVLCKHPNGVPQKSIAKWLGQTEAAISRQMQGMQEQGLIKSSVQPENRRQNIICLTDKGRDFANEAMHWMKQAQGEVFEVLSSAEQQSLNHMFEKVLGAVAKKNNWK